MSSKLAPGMLAPLLVGLAVVVAVIMPPYFPTIDGPQNVYLAYVLKTWPALSTWYDRSIPLTSAGFPVFFFPLAMILPWMWAYRIALGLIALLWYGASLALARALHPDRAIAAVLTGSLVLGWSLAMGFFSFVVGTALSIWALASVVDAQSSRAAAIKSQVLFSLAVIAHLFAGTLGIATAALVCIFTQGSVQEKLVRAVSRIAVPSLLVLLFVGLTRQDVLPSGEAEYLQGDARILFLFKMGFGGPYWRAVPPMLLAAWAAGRCLSQAKDHVGDRREWALALAAIGCLVMAVLAPLHLPGWMHFSPRFLPLALVLGISLVPFEQIEARYAKNAKIAAVAFAALSIFWFGLHFYRLSAAVEPYLAVTRAAVKRTGPRLPILSTDPWFAGIGTMDVPFPFADPVYNIPLLTAIEQGGVLPYTFTTTRLLHPFVDRRGRPAYPKTPMRERFWLGLVDPEVRAKPLYRRALLTDVASHASRFEDVILFGAPEDQKVFDALGFESNWRSDAGYIATFKGCPVTLGIKTTDEALQQFNVSYGWFPLKNAHWSKQVTRTGELTKVELPGAPCGPLWAEVKTDDAAIVCAGAQRDGRLVAFERTQQKALICALQRAER